VIRVIIFIFPYLCANFVHTAYILFDKHIAVNSIIILLMLGFSFWNVLYRNNVCILCAIVNPKLR